MIASNVKSSLSLQMLLILNRRYSTFLFIAMILIYLYKGNILPYQSHVRIMELLILLAFAPTEAVRLSWAARGNLTETAGYIGFSLFLSVAVMLICTYLGIFQNYVLMIEAIILGIEGIFVLIESLIGLALCATFSRGED